MRKSSRKTTFQSKPIVKGFLNQKYDDITRNSNKFTDPLFEPNDSSLYSSKSELVNYKPTEIPSFLKEDGKKLFSQFGLNRKENRYSWKRLSDLYSTRDLNVLSTPKEGLVKDIIQGELGDCYFLSALAALAENPDRIKELFKNTKVSDKGVYECLVYINGENIPIVLDDFVPVVEQSGFEPQIAFAGINPDSNNIWPLLLEKAWAKCNQSYEDIATGNCGEAFRFLTSAPVDTFYHNTSSETLFDDITKALEKQYLVMTDITVTAESNIESLSKMGLITNHAYSVIETLVLKDNYKNEIRLLKIKNQWGTNEWLGDWSDGSRKWTEEFKQQANLEEKEDGVFWMAYEDFLNFYTSTHICHVSDKYKLVSSKFTPSGAFNVISVNVPKEVSGSFEVNMKNQRIYSNLKGLDKFENPYVSVTVFKKDGDDLVYVGSDSGRQDRLYVELDEIPKGTYFVAVNFPEEKDVFALEKEITGKDFEKMHFKVGLYSSLSNVEITEASDKEKESLGNFIENIVEDIAKKNTNKYYFIEEGEKTSYRVINFENSTAGFGYIFYENNSDAFIREKISITELENVNIIPVLGKGKFTQYESTEKEEVEYEDPSAREVVRNLREALPLESTVEVLSSKNQKPSAKNPIEIQFNVAPHSKSIIILQKTENSASIDFTSDICFDYLPNVLLTEEKFKQRIIRLKYNNKPVEVYETVTEHNTGALFQYKNRSRDLLLTITISFDHINNLYLNINSDDAQPGKPFKVRENKGKFNEDDDKDEVTLTVKPGQTKFFGVKAIDVFEKYSYTCEIDYNFVKYEEKILDEDDENKNDEE